MKTITISAFRSELSKYRRKVLRGDRILLTQYNQPVAKLLPIKDIDQTISLARDCSTSELRTELTEVCEELASGSLMCVYLTFHGRRLAALVDHEWGEPSRIEEKDLREDVFDVVVRMLRDRPDVKREIGI